MKHEEQKGISDLRYDAARTLSEKVDSFYNDEGFDLNDEKNLKIIKDIISLEDFGKNLDLAESVYRLLHDKGPVTINDVSKENYLEEIFTKTKKYTNHHSLSKRIFYPGTILKTTDQFIFRIEMQRLEADSRIKLDESKSLFFMFFKSRPKIKDYVENYFGLKDAKGSSFAELVATSGGSPLVSVAALAAIFQEGYDLEGGRPPEAPLKLTKEEEGEGFSEILGY